MQKDTSSLVRLKHDVRSELDDIKDKLEGSKKKKGREEIPLSDVIKHVLKENQRLKAEVEVLRKEV
jgi:hypothetical protein